MGRRDRRVRIFVGVVFFFQRGVLVFVFVFVFVFVCGT